MPSSDETIVLGEFLVDPDSSLKAMENMYRFQKIQELQRKLQQAKDRQTPPITPSSIVIGLEKRRETAKGINHPKQYVKAYCACRAVGAQWCKQTTDRAYAPREDADLSVDMAVD